jgi:hypothetical protein
MSVSARLDSLEMVLFVEMSMSAKSTMAAVIRMLNASTLTDHFDGNMPLSHFLHLCTALLYKTQKSLIAVLVTPGSKEMDTVVLILMNVPTIRTFVRMGNVWTTPDPSGVRYVLASLFRILTT